MARGRRRRVGTIRLFTGGWRAWRDWLHPRGPDGRFIDKPDYWVSPAAQRRTSNAQRIEAADRLIADDGWKSLERSRFDVPQPHDGGGWGLRPYAGSGALWRSEDPAFSGWRVDPTMPPGAFVRYDDSGFLVVGEDFFDLSSAERRHALYAALAEGRLHMTLDERRALFGPYGNYANVYTGGLIRPADAPPDANLEGIEDTAWLLSGTTEVDMAQVPDYLDWRRAHPERQPQLDAMVREMQDGAWSRAPIVVDGDDLSRAMDTLVAAKYAYTGMDGVRPFTSLEVVRTLPEERPLNGRVSEREMLAEAYAMLADGDADWLDENFPGLAPIVRREAIASGLPVDDGEIAAPEPNDSRFRFGEEPEFPTPLPPFRPGDDLEKTTEGRRRYSDAILAMASRGEIDWEDASALALSGMPPSESWHAAPPRLYHVGTATTKILDEGFRSRADLDMKAGVGLGGGADNVVSFTDDLQTAEDIYSAMMEARAYASGELTLGDLLAQDLDDRWGVGPGAVFASVLRTHNGVDWEPGQPLPEAYERLLAAKPSEEGWEVYRNFIWARDHLGGPSDPLFFSTDWEGLGAIAPEEISILTIDTNPDTWGQVMGSLHEWRIHPSALPDEVAQVTRPALVDDFTAPYTLYRGIDLGSGYSAEDVDAIAEDPAGWLADSGVLEGAIGQHWSGSYNVAHDFATGASEDFEPNGETGRPFTIGIVLQAEVPVSSVVQPGTAEYRDIMDGDGVFDRNHPENEFYVDRGKPLSITSADIVVFDELTGQMTEEWVRPEALAERFGANPIDVSALRQGPRTYAEALARLRPWRRWGSARAYAALTPSEQIAVSLTMGLPLAHFPGRSVSAKQVQDLVGDLHSLPAVAWSLNHLGFDVASPPGMEPLGDRGAVAVLLANRDRLSVDPSGVRFTMPDGRIITHPGFTAAIEQMNPRLPGDTGYALASLLAPELVPRGAFINDANPVTDEIMLTGALLRMSLPDSDITDSYLATVFNFDRNSTNPPGARVVPSEAGKRFAEVVPEASPESIQAFDETYTELTERFPTVGFADILRMEGDVWGAGIPTGALAFTTPAGTTYWNPKLLTDEALDRLAKARFVAEPSIEGLVAHEFAHRLFAGQTGDTAHRAAASYALEAAAPSLLGEGAIVGAAARLSRYADTEPAEAYAELFAHYIVGGDRRPQWVVDWGTKFEQAYNEALAAGASGVSSEVANMHALPFARPMLSEYRPVTTIPYDLQAELSSERRRFGGFIHTRDVQERLGDYLTSAYSQIKPPFANSVWTVSNGDSPDVVEMWGDFGNGSVGVLWTTSERGITLHDPRLTPDDIENAVRLYVEQSSAYGPVQLFQSPMGVPSSVPMTPPQLPDDLARSYLSNLRRMAAAQDPAPPDGLSEEFDRLVATYPSSMGEILQVPAIRQYANDLARTQDGFRVATMDVDARYYRARNARVAEEVGSLGLIERPEPLSELRRAKLAKTYGEDFATAVRGEMEHLGHPPLVAFPALRQQHGEGYYVQEDFEALMPDFLDHFTDFTMEVPMFEAARGDDDSYIFDASGEVVYEEVGQEWLSVRVDGYRVDEDSVVVDFIFEGSDSDETVGSCQRAFYFDGSVGHELLALEPQYQGKGIGYAWNRHNDAWYLANGLTKVNVHAAMTKGGYEWLSDFFTPHGGTSDMRDRIEARADRIIAGKDPAHQSAEALLSALQAKVDLEALGPDATPWEVAHVGYREEVARSREWIGRLALNGMSWVGTKDLAGLLRESGAGGSIVDSIPKAGQVSYRPPDWEEWHPFWQEWEQYDSDRWGSEWLASRLRGEGFGDAPAIDRMTSRSTSTLAPLLETPSGQLLSIPEGGFEQREIFAPLRSLPFDEQVQIGSELAALAERGEGLSFIESDEPARLTEALVDLVEERSANYLAPGAVEDLAFIATDDGVLIQTRSFSNVDEAEAEEFIDTLRWNAFRSDNLPYRYDAAHLGHPDSPFLSRPLSIQSVEDRNERIFRSDDGTVQLQFLFDREHHVITPTLPDGSTLSDADLTTILCDLLTAKGGARDVGSSTLRLSPHQYDLIKAAPEFRRPWASQGGSGQLIPRGGRLTEVYGGDGTLSHVLWSPSGGWRTEEVLAVGGIPTQLRPLDHPGAGILAAFRATLTTRSDQRPPRLDNPTVTESLGTFSANYPLTNADSDIPIDQDAARDVVGNIMGRAVQLYRSGDAADWDYFSFELGDPGVAADVAEYLRSQRDDFHALDGGVDLDGSTVIFRLKNLASGPPTPWYRPLPEITTETTDPDAATAALRESMAEWMERSHPGNLVFAMTADNARDLITNGVGFRMHSSTEGIYIQTELGEPDPALTNVTQADSMAMQMNVLGRQLYQFIEDHNRVARSRGDAQLFVVEVEHPGLSFERAERALRADIPLGAGRLRTSEIEGDPPVVRMDFEVL